MKTILIVGILVVGVSGQALSMGHPHNMFAARKQMRTKASTSVARNKVTASICWQRAVQTTKAVFAERLLGALANVRPTQAD